MTTAAAVPTLERTLDPSQVQVRPAMASDVPEIFDLIGYWAAKRQMLVRPMPNIFENLRDFFVAEIVTDEGREFVGCAALHVLWGDIAEVRGLAVKDGVRGGGIGKKLVSACEQEARRIGIPQLFAWTYSVGFFAKCGFEPVDKTRDLHPRVWSECLRCPFFAGCNENGMRKRLAGVPMPSNLPEPPPAHVPPGIR